MSEPLIRLATLADIPAIAAIYGEAVLNGTATFETEPPDEAEMAGRLAAIERSGHPWLVAEVDGAVAGYAYAGPYRTRAAYFRTVEDAIYLAADARGKGIGRALLAALVAEAERRGFRQMLAVIGDSANLPSIRVHAACGFTPTGTFRNVGWKHGRWLDTVLMQRALGQGAGTPP